MSIYALLGDNTRDLLSYQGRVIVHGDRAEMEWLIPYASVVRVTGDVGPTIQLRDHPDMQAVRWPLRRSDFVM